MLQRKLYENLILLNNVKDKSVMVSHFYHVSGYNLNLQVLTCILHTKNL